MMNRGMKVAASMQRVVTASRVTAYAVCLLSSFLNPVHAEDLPDPTRPPAGIFTTGAGTGAGREAAGNRSTGLHTIIISDTRRAAIIDGKTVELGGEHGGAKLIEVNEGGVVMQRAQSRQVLALFPDVKIIRKTVPDKEPAEQVKQQSSANKVQSNKHQAKPTAHYEELLSGHPKEEK
jgi:hypothetical protein